MNTYTETQGNEPFDWKAALTSETPNWGDLKRRALKWPTCAIGNACDELPCHKNGVPEDGVLGRLGVMFWTNISNLDAERALQTLDMIERRAAELLPA